MVVEGRESKCDLCVFKDRCEDMKIPRCSKFVREDRKDVYFKEVNQQ